MRSRRRDLAALATILGLVLPGVGLPGCDGSGAPPEPPHHAAPPPAPEAPALATDDLPGIRRRGELRVLVQRRSEAWLPRDGSPLDADRDRARHLADELGLRATFVAVDRFEELIPALLEGRGDLVVENLTVTEARAKRVAFSVPIELVREHIVTRSRDDALHGPPDLAGRSLAVQRSSAFWQTAQALQKQHPGLRIEAAPEELDVDALLDAVASHRFDLTVMDSNVTRAATTWRDDLRVAIDLQENRVIAWAMRPDAVQLRAAVDGFLARASRGPEALERRTRTGDLPALRERGVLRVITRNSSSTYFITRGELVGFEYDLARRFAERHGLRIEIVVPPSRDDLFPWLRDGRGDVIAAGLTVQPGLAGRERIAFSRMMHEVRQTVVGRANDPDRPTPDSLEALSGRSFAVRKSSAYWQTLEKLQRDGVDLQLVAAPEDLETEEIVARVASGDYDLTLADSHIAAIERSWRDDVAAGLQIGDQIAHGWAVRREDEKLLAAIDAFFDAEYRGLFYNVTRDKYFANASSIQERLASRPRNTGWISPYDDLVQAHAPRFGFDWRLITAQMFQESRFDPKARSFAGARGLLQVMPRTARELGYQNLEDPETGIRAGLDYLAWVRERFDPDLPSSDRTWMSLAGYNVGAGHVRDAQRIAVDQGLDPTRWFGHVETALLLKQKPEFHRKTRYGYARAREPVAYVRNIRDRYQAYIQAQAAADAARRGR